MKGFKIRIVLYVLIFIGAAVLTYIFTIGKTVYRPNTNDMEAAGLPVIYMTAEGGLKYNYLHGYTSDVNEKLIHDAITPIDNDRRMIISVKQYGCVVSGVSYEVMTPDQEVLVERSTISDYQGRKGVIIAEFEFKDLLETGKEYLLKIILNTEKYGEVSYYTRMVKYNEPDVARKLNYVNDFSENTRNEETLSKVTAKLETNSSADNTNLGRVDIHCKLSQVGFGALQPELLSDRYFTITEIDEERASIYVTYKAKTNDDAGVFEYNIDEYYRIYQPDETVTYVYNFERWMNQVFKPKSGITGRGEIYLGIRSDTDINMKKSANGNITAFELDGNMWTFSATKNNFNQIFSFEDLNTDGVREAYDAHDYKILNVYNNGNVDFLVYGYMNRGMHEGELGISVCQYDAANKLTREIAFIPRTDSYEIIARDIEKLAYLNDSNILYIYSNNSIFYLDCDTKEYMVVASDVISEVSKLCEEKSIFAYQVGTDINACTELFILNLNNGQIFSKKAEQGEVVKILGFIDGNVVYGKMKNEMLYESMDGDIITPMYAVTIMDENNKTIRDYKESGIFVTGASFSETQIVFERMTYNEEGSLVYTDTDSILSSASDTGVKLAVVTRATEMRQKEQYISLAVAGAPKAGNNTCKYEYSDNSTVLISEIYEQEPEYYYAYGYGKLYRICQTLSEAMAAAYESGGVVVDSDANTIWNRYKVTEYEIDLPEDVFPMSGNSLLDATNAVLKIAGKEANAEKFYNEGYSTLECLETKFGKSMDLSGSPIDYALYYVGKGHPLIAKTGDNQYEMVYAYDSYYVYTCDFINGKEKFYSKTIFDELITQYESVLITY